MIQSFHSISAGGYDYDAVISID